MRMGWQEFLQAMQVVEEFSEIEVEQHWDVLRLILESLILCMHRLLVL